MLTKHIQEEVPNTKVEGMGTVEEQKVADNDEANKDETLTQIKELLTVLGNHEGAPDEYTLNSWKMTYGKYFASSIVGTDVYVWRTLKRMEHKQIVSQHTEDTPQDVYENAIVKRCLLWPAPTNDYLTSTDAGVIPTLQKQIMHQSGFISEENAIAMIRRI